MSAFILNHEGNRIDVELSDTVYKEAKDAGMSVAQLINQKHAKACDPKYGTPFEQASMSVGLVLTGKQNPFGQRSSKMSDILDGKASAAANVEQKGDPFGKQSRLLFPAYIIEAIESTMQPDTLSDDQLFRSLAVTTVPIPGDVYQQPTLSYQNAGGANNGTQGAKAGRVVQMAQVPTVLFLGTSDKARNLPTYGIGVEMSDKALQNTTLDLFTLTMNRFFSLEKDARVYQYMSNLFTGDLDQNSGAVPAVTTTSLDPAASAGTVTHRAWLKFLARRRRFRKITVCIADLDTYLKVESRTGRPGSNNYDPSLHRIDPQVNVLNNTFGADVKWIIVDSAAEGGPVPANTIWALDESKAFMFVTNTEAAYQATESFALRRSSSMVWHWSEECLRLWGDTELQAFDVLTIA